MLFLDASGILYPAVGEPNKDPWFAASMPLNQYTGSEEQNDFYIADEPASPVGCATHTYICNPRLPAGSKCVSSFQEVLLHESLATIWTNDNERAQVQGALRFLAAEEVFDPDMFYRLPGLPTLQTQYSIEGPVQADHIPDDRWQTEMEFIFQANLASLQAALVETATGDLLWERDADYNINGDIIAGCAPAAAYQAVCGRQMIRSPGHYSFSVLGLCIVLCLGGAFILFGFFIENVAYAIDWLRTHGKSDTSPITYAQGEWNSGSPLQLQRLANEALGLGAWSGAQDAIPVTDCGDVLGVLDVRDKKHPRLMNPQLLSGEVLEDNSQDIEKQPAATARPVMGIDDN
ncbi:hypothetical protein NX059_007200 [Plenodomus lindquistii]|nr:hypothetical protein NX059_007200 [Plenodomus lindquistii]